MITDVGAFLRYFDGVHRRTVRDVSALPADAETWRPAPGPDEEASWGIPKIVGHMAESRTFFGGVCAGRGWRWEPWEERLDSRDSWAPALERSRERLAELLEVGPEQLRAKVPMLGDPGRSLSAWRALLMMVEHEVHHRSQLATYAGLNGWPVHQLFDRTNEWVVAHPQPSGDA